MLGDPARERPRAEPAQKRAREHAHREDVVEQPVDDRVAPGHELELDAVAVLHDGAQHAAHRRQPVDHGHLRVLRRLFDLAGERACCGGVSLADVGAEDQDAAPGARVRACARVGACAARLRRAG